MYAGVIVVFTHELAVFSSFSLSKRNRHPRSRQVGSYYASTEDGTHCKQLQIRCTRLRTFSLILNESEVTWATSVKREYKVSRWLTEIMTRYRENVQKHLTKHSPRACRYHMAGRDFGVNCLRWCVYKLLKSITLCTVVYDRAFRIVCSFDCDMVKNLKSCRIVRWRFWFRSESWIWELHQILTWRNRTRISVALRMAASRNTIYLQSPCGIAAFPSAMSLLKPDGRLVGTLARMSMVTRTRSVHTVPLQRATIVHHSLQLADISTNLKPKRRSSERQRRENSVQATFDADLSDQVHFLILFIAQNWIIKMNRIRAERVCQAE